MASIRIVLNRSPRHFSYLSHLAKPASGNAVTNGTLRPSAFSGIYSHRDHPVPRLLRASKPFVILPCDQNHFDRLRRHLCFRNTATVEDAVASPTETGQVFDEFQFPSAMLISPMMSLKIVRTVAHLAPITGLCLHGIGHPFPVIRFQVIRVSVLRCFHGRVMLRERE